MTRFLAWLVHLYTAMGLVCAAGMAVLIVHGGDASFRGAFLLMMVATAIDATDGWLARKARVKEVLPGFDGAALDNLIDFQTYTTLPLLLIWRAGLHAGRPRLAAAVPAPRQRLRLLADPRRRQPMASSWDSRRTGTSSRSISTRSQPQPWVSVALIMTCAVLTFVPTPYLYATRGGPFAKTINIGSAVWFVSLGFVLFGPEE